MVDHDVAPCSDRPDRRTTCRGRDAIPVTSALVRSDRDRCGLASDVAGGLVAGAAAQPCQRLANVVDDDECSCAWLLGSVAARLLEGIHVEPLSDGVTVVGQLSRVVRFDDRRVLDQLRWRRCEDDVGSSQGRRGNLGFDARHVNHDSVGVDGAGAGDTEVTDKFAGCGRVDIGQSKINPADGPVLLPVCTQAQTGRCHSSVALFWAARILFARPQAMV